MDAISQVHVTFPAATHAFDAVGGGSATGMEVSAAGTGSFTGLSYTVPGHTKGTLKATIQVMCLTSQDIADLNSLVKSMLSASEWSKVESHEKITASANLSFWSMLFGNAAHSSYEKTTDAMSGFGLTSAQIGEIIDKLFDMASKMNHVELDFTIDNMANDYTVSGDLQLYTIAGTVKTEKGTAQYRMLADQGTAGSNNATAKASGKVIPLS